MHNETWSIETVSIKDPDDLCEATRGSDFNIVQLKPGELHGSIKQFGSGELGIITGRFNSKVRTRGTMHRERVVLGTLLDGTGLTTQWWKEMKAGDVGVFPSNVEIDVIHSGPANYLTVSIPLLELASMLSGEEHLADPTFWSTKGIYQIGERISAQMQQRLKWIISGIERCPDHDTDFLKRSIIEIFVVGLMSALPQDSRRSRYTGARLVTEAEDYVDAVSERPVHISELCSALKVPRRSLHRAFADTLGIGPVAYLRRRRLSAIRSVLKRCDPATISIGDLAFEYGFPEPGRFAAYYRDHFGETPSQTCLSRKGKRDT